MPTCPGCERSVPYDRLSSHQRHCWALHGGDRISSRRLEQLERRLDEVERRLQRRLGALEAELDEHAERRGPPEATR